MGLVILIVGVVMLFLPKSIVGASFPETGVAIICAVVAIIVSLIEKKKGKKIGEISFIGSIIFLIILVVIVVFAFLIQVNNNKKLKNKMNIMYATNIVDNIKYSAQDYFVEVAMTSNFNLTVFWCNGDECISKDGQKLDLNGATVPTSGTITIFEDGSVKGENLSIGNFICRFSKNERPTCE